MGDTNTANEQVKLISLDNLETYTEYVERKGIDITYEDYQKLTPEEKANKTYYVTDYESGGSADAHDISYDNEDSGLTATDVQEAIDEVCETIGTLPTSDTTYTLEAGTGDDANKIVLTPSSGTAQKITVPYATDAGTVNGKTVASNVPANAVFTDTTYTAATSAPGDIASAGSVGTSTDYARQDHTHGITVAQGDNNGQVKIAGQNVAVKGLGSAAFTATTDYIASSTKGANNGVAELDANGKVPSAQLPSYVDDVIEGYLYNGHFYKESTHTTEIAGETGKIYVNLTTEKTYRWSGSAFVEISESLALGETSSTAYAGDKGKANADAITAIKDGTTIDSFSDVESAISTLQSNFQDGVDDVYDAIVARGTTPASKSLSDVVTGIGNIETTHTTTYKPTSRASNNDMGKTHYYRYVNTTAVPNSNSGTYSPTTKSTFDLGVTNTYRFVDTTGVVNVNSGTYAVTSNGVKDMGTDNTQRYVNVSVPNTNTGTYTPAGNDIYDMGATNDKRYCDGRTAYSAGYSAKRAELTGTYKPTSRASNLDMGSNHTYRYVNTNSVPNSNSGTQTITTNGTTDMGATNDKRYVSVSVANSNSGTYTPAGNAIYDMGATNDKRYCDGRTAYAAGQANPPTQTKTATPSTSAQTVSPDSGKFLSKVTVNAIPNLHTTNSMIVPKWNTDAGSSVPATRVQTLNPRIDFNNASTYGSAEMIEIAMPEGYYAWSYGNSSCCIPTETKTVTAGTSASTVTPTEYNTKGKYVKFLKSVTVNPTPSQEKTVTASRSAQTVSPDSGKLLSKVTVNKYPDASGTYEATSRGSALDMGATNNLRYVNTNGVPNSNSGTYSATSNGLKDMGATNTQRYVNVSVANSNSGTYTPTTKSTFDMGATNDKRYVDTRSVANVNSGTASYTANGIQDMGAANTYRYVNINVPHPTHTTTYKPTSRASNLDMGSVHSYRYVDTRSVPNSNSGTYTPAGNAIYDMGSTNDKRYCDGRTAYTAGYNAKVAALTGTYTPTSRASNLDMGSNHTYRYVNTNSVPNSNSGTYGSVTSNGVKDMGATNSYRYCNINVPNSNSGTYTYASGSTGGTIDMGATNSYRYVNATNVYNKGKTDGAAALSMVTNSTTISNIDVSYLYYTTVTNEDAGVAIPSNYWLSSKGLSVTKTGALYPLYGSGGSIDNRYTYFTGVKLPVGTYTIIYNICPNSTSSPGSPVDTSKYKVIIYSGNGSIISNSINTSRPDKTNSDIFSMITILARVNITSANTIVEFIFKKGITNQFRYTGQTIQIFA